MPDLDIIIVAGDTQAVPVLMPSGKDVEEYPAPVDLALMLITALSWIVFRNWVWYNFLQYKPINRDCAPRRRTDEDINGFDDKKFELEQKYAAMFVHGVPREMFPPGISEDEIMKAVESCVQNQKDELMKILDVEEL